MKALLAIAWIALVLLVAATVYSIGESRARTACYKSGKSECGQPDLVERAVAALLS